jgi:hypothetical protein
VRWVTVAAHRRDRGAVGRQGVRVVGREELATRTRRNWGYSTGDIVSLISHAEHSEPRNCPRPVDAGFVEQARRAQQVRRE